MFRNRNGFFFTLTEWKSVARPGSGLRVYIRCSFDFPTKLSPFSLVTQVPWILMMLLVCPLCLLLSMD